MPNQFVLIDFFLPYIHYHNLKEQVNWLPGVIEKIHTKINFTVLHNIVPVLHVCRNYFTNKMLLQLLTELSHNILN